MSNDGQEDDDMTGLPIHVRVKMQAAAQAEQDDAAQAGVTPVQTVATADAGEVPATDAGETGQAQPAEAVSASEPAEDVAVLKQKLTELEFVNKKQKERLNTGYGRQRAVNERLAKEIETLRAENARLAALKSAESGSAAEESDEAVLKRADWTQEEIDEASPSEIKRTARMIRKQEADRKALEDRLAALGKQGVAETAAVKTSAIDAAIDAKFPGVRDAMKRGGDADVDWNIFRDEPNPDSEDGKTNGECYDEARKLGNRMAAVGIIEQFVKDNNLPFGGSVESTSGRAVEVPPRRLMPSSGPAVPESASSTTSADTDTKRTFKQSYIDAFTAKYARNQGGSFRPFVVNVGGAQTVFKTLKDAEQEDAAISDAFDNSRVDLHG
jgi:hypothetical protein